MFLADARRWSVDSSIFRRSENAGFAYVGVDHARKWVVASFKGTNDTVDWMHDLQGLEFSFDPCRLPSGNTRGTVHKGFCEYYVKLAKLGVAGNFTALMEKHSDYTPVVHCAESTTSPTFRFNDHAVSLCNRLFVSDPLHFPSPCWPPPSAL